MNPSENNRTALTATITTAAPSREEALVVEALTSMLTQSPALPPPPLPSPPPLQESKTTSLVFSTVSDSYPDLSAKERIASTTNLSPKVVSIAMDDIKPSPSSSSSSSIVMVPTQPLANTASSSTSISSSLSSQYQVPSIVSPLPTSNATMANTTTTATHNTSDNATYTASSVCQSVEPRTPAPSSTNPTQAAAASSSSCTTRKVTCAAIPILPARVRKPPKPLSRKQRRKALTAPCPRPCLAHTPSLVQLQSITFSDYVQKIVLASAVPCDEASSSDDEEEEEDDDNDEDNGPRDDRDGDDRDEEEEAYDAHKKDWTRITMPLAEGIAKVTLPDGFWPTESSSWTQGDRTGRGPAWQSGTALGDYPLEAPIAQHVRGLAGIYEFSFVDKPPTTLAQFRDKADTYRQQHVGCAYDIFQSNDKDQSKTMSTVTKVEETLAATTDPKINQKEECTTYASRKRSNLPDKPNNVFANEAERMEYLERFFWKRLGPTMPSAWYGADHEGTLFPEDDIATGWSLGQLDSCLHVLPKVPGVTSPYLYAGMWASVFCAHSEDMNLLSINYLHAGAPKLWYAIAPGPDAQRFESLCASSFAGTPSTKGCKEFLRHKRSLLSPKILQKAGIKYTTAIQRPGDAIITFPAGYHFGFNTGFNVAEATNFAVPEWIPYGWQARVCLCRPDSVRIDMHRLTGLLQEFDKDQSRWRRKRLSWKEWSNEKHSKRLLPQQSQQSEQQSQQDRKSSRKSGKKRKEPLSDQQRKREFWVEVVKPLAKSKQASAATVPTKREKPRADPDAAGRGKRKRKLTAKAAKLEREQQRKKTAVMAPHKEPTVVVEEIWHLAKPLPRGKGVHYSGMRILCLLPGTSMGYAPKNQWRAGVCASACKKDEDSDEEEEIEHSRRQRKNVTDDEEEQEEQCFKGQIVEVSDDFARVHIDGLPRTEDVWMDLWSNKIFLDGGLWDEDEAKKQDPSGRTLPQLHYWQEMDSKRRCV